MQPTLRSVNMFKVHANEKQKDLVDNTYNPESIFQKILIKFVYIIIFSNIIILINVYKLLKLYFRLNQNNLIQ